MHEMTASGLEGARYLVRNLGDDTGCATKAQLRKVLFGRYRGRRVAIHCTRPENRAKVILFVVVPRTGERLRYSYLDAPVDLEVLP
ncbi:MAG: hypothetical protein D6775_14795 [Caldilineae bacterium]|nr:MAG: hypothetical protein D6775_14795 [Caldilineae bacterium]